MRTLSAQGESVDSAIAAIPPDLLVPPTPHPRTAPTPKPLVSAGAPDTKDEHLGPHTKVEEAWEQSRTPTPAHGHMLEPPGLQGSGPGRRSPSPSRILPQPQGAPVSTSVAKAMAREAAQRVAESSRVRLGVLAGATALEMHSVPPAGWCGAVHQHEPCGRRTPSVQCQALPQFGQRGPHLPLAYISGLIPTESNVPVVCEYGPIGPEGMWL